jgi:hypothetical protein
MMEPQALTRRDLETALIEKCWKDSEFKMAVLSDPKGMLERHIGQKLPAQLRIVVHEEDASTLHFSVPPAPSNLTELSDDDLEKVAGGTDVLLITVLSAAAGLFSAGVTAEAAITKIGGGW